MTAEDAERRALAALEAAAAELEGRTAPEPGFQRRLRDRLVAVAGVRGAGEVPVPGRRRSRGEVAPVRRRSGRRALTLLAGAAALALLAVGVTVGTSHALPGSPLYPAKRTVESLELRREAGPLDEGIARLHLAEERLREVRALADGHRFVDAGPVGPGLAAPSADRLRATLAAMDAQTRAGSRLVEQVARTSGDGAPLTVLQAWAGMQSGHLEQVTRTLPAASRERAQASLAVLQDLTATATALLAPGCLAPGATCPGTGPR